MTAQAATTAAGSSPAEVAGRLRATFASGRTRSLAWRLRQLEGVERLCDESEAELVAAVQQDLGRGPVESWLTEIANTRGEARYARRHLRSWMRRRPQGVPRSQLPGLAWVQYQPLGVVLVIGPWNYPVFLALTPLVSALAAGNCAVLKPSELAPATSAVLARLLPRYLDPDAVAVVEGDGRVAQELLAQGFDHVLFTGGTEIGREVMAGAAPHLTPVTLELGGKSPVFVDADADLDVTARRIALVKWVNSGQTCVAPDYVLAHSSIRDELVERIAADMVAFRSDQPPGGQRVVDKRQFDRLVGYLALTRGAIVHGGASDRERLTVEPTIVLDPAADEPLMSEEIFGPILPVISVASVDDAIRFVNGRPKPLGAYVFSRSRAHQRRFADEVASGATVVNDLGWQVFVPSLPFGGVGPSGMGGYHGRWGFETFSNRKAVLAKPFRPEVRIAYPPYSNRAVRLLRRVF